MVERDVLGGAAVDAAGLVKVNEKFKPICNIYVVYFKNIKIQFTQHKIVKINEISSLQSNLINIMTQMVTGLVVVECAPVQVLHALAEAGLRDLVVSLEELSELV